jgi:signal transduction histidine kinase/ligand-binding sensor domain-containing protein
MRLLSLVSMLGFLSITGRAQYRFDWWTTDSGLPQNSVHSIIQTRDGYLWFTTLDGVVRYDGVNFRIFNRGNTPGIESNRFFKLVEGPDGTIWMATEDGGVTCYANGHFKTFTTRDGLSSNAVLGVWFDNEGSLFVRALPGTVRWTEQRFVPSMTPGSDAEESLVHRSRSGAVWYYDRSGLHRADNDRISTVASVGRPLDEVTSVYEDRKGEVWVGGNTGLVRVKDDIVTRYPLGFKRPGSYIKTMLEDSRGDIWIATIGEGLMRINGEKITRYTTADGLSDNSILSIFEDREGTLWVGTLNRGINRLSRRLISVYSSSDGLTGDNVYPIYEDPHGRLWIGARGLNKFAGGRFKGYAQKDGLPFYDVMSLFEDREGRLWIGSVGGLSYMKDGRFVDFTSRIPLPVQDYNVWAIHQDARGTMWFGTDRGLVSYYGDHVRLFTTRDGLAFDDVKCILEDRSGKLWFGTYGGISYLDDGRFESLTEKDGLVSNRVRTLFEDENGTLWIGTYDGGLSRYRDGRFTNYTASDGLFNSGVFQVLDDLRGNFWMSCNRGIYRVSKQQLDDFAQGKIKTIACVAYGKEDGLVNTECNGGRQPSGVRTRDGKLWFPTAGGAAVIDLADLNINPLPPALVMEEVLVEHEQVATAGIVDGIVQIAPGKQSLEIRYNGLSFIKPEQVQFRYRMEGLDRGWIDAGNRRIAYYPYLPPGNYTFVVSAANSDGVWSADQRLAITVLPPFWRTWWFTALAAAAIVTMAWLTYRRRVSGLERARAAQEAFSMRLIDSQESERKRIAGELHDSLGQNLLVIKNWAALGLRKMRADDPGREELEEISSAASSAIGEVREISYDLRPHLLDEAGLAEALRSMTKRVALASGIEFEIEIDPLDGALSKQAEIGVYRIVQEAVNNIVRHSGAARAKIVIRRDLNGVLIQVVDDGKGLASATADADRKRGRKGFGMLGMSERARMLGGRLTIESNPGHGTTIEVRLGGEGMEQ